MTDAIWEAKPKSRLVKALTATREFWDKWFDFTLNVCFPPLCVGCEAVSGSFLCNACVMQLNPPEKGACPNCHAARAPSGRCVLCEYGDFQYDSISAVCQMDGVGRKLVHELKYHDLRASASKIGEMMTEYVATRTDLEYDVLMPLPIHWARHMRRGYNQSQLLGKVISRKLEIPMDDKSLKRIKNTPPQVSLKGLDERVYSMQAAFRCDTDLKGANILLLDDVVTSGSTVNEATIALKQADAGEVHILAFARGGWVR